MAHEVQGIVTGGGGGRAEEWHDPEPAGEDQPQLNRAPGRPEGGAPPGMTYEEVEERSRLGRFIPMASLPGDRDELLRGAADLHAPDDIMATLSRLPADEQYATVSEIWAALGHANESRRT